MNERMSVRRDVRKKEQTNERTNEHRKLEHLLSLSNSATDNISAATCCAPSFEFDDWMKKNSKDEGRGRSWEEYQHREMHTCIFAANYSSRRSETEKKIFCFTAYCWIIIITINIIIIIISSVPLQLISLERSKEFLKERKNDREGNIRLWWWSSCCWWWWWWSASVNEWASFFCCPQQVSLILSSVQLLREKLFKESRPRL